MDNVAEEYPLPTAPTLPVMRHPDTRKWFAIIMDVPKGFFRIRSFDCRVVGSLFDEITGGVTWQLGTST